MSPNPNPNPSPNPNPNPTPNQVKPPALPKRRLAPSKWSAALVREWVAEVQGGALAELLPLLPAGLDGRALSRLSARQMGAMWKCPHKDELCTLLFNELRTEMKKVSRRPAATPWPSEAATPCARGDALGAMR